MHSTSWHLGPMGLYIALFLPFPGCFKSADVVHVSELDSEIYHITIQPQRSIVAIIAGPNSLLHSVAVAVNLSSFEVLVPVEHDVQCTHTVCKLQSESNQTLGIKIILHLI